MPDATPKPARQRAPRDPVPYQLRELIRRAQVVQSVLRMLHSGKSLNEAAAVSGEPLANLSRYVSALRTRGVAGLVPEISTGRKSSAARLALTDAEAAAIAALAIRVVRREDIAAGCRAYAASPDCRAELRAVLTGYIPRSVRVAVRSHLPPP